jgi:hypothetical protein
LHQPAALNSLASQLQWAIAGLADPRWLSAVALYLLLRFVGNELVSLMLAGGLFWVLR